MSGKESSLPKPKPKPKPKPYVKPRPKPPSYQAACARKRNLSSHI